MKIDVRRLVGGVRFVSLLFCFVRITNRGINPIRRSGRVRPRNPRVCFLCAVKSIVIRLKRNSRGYNFIAGAYAGSTG